MSRWTAYVILAVPAVVTLPFVFILASRVKLVKFEGLLQSLRDLLVGAILARLMINQGISASQVGLSPRAWPVNLAVGMVAGLAQLGLQSLLRRWTASVGQPKQGRAPLQRPTTASIPSLVLSAFIEEFWIALSIAAMTKSAHSNLAATLVTAIVFGFSHLPLGIDVVPAMTLSAIPSCLLYFWRRSLIPLFLYHLIGNLGAIYSGRGHTFTSDPRKRIP